MNLIVDSNIIFAALLKASTVRHLLINPPFSLYAPEAMLTEIRRYEAEIRKRAEYTQDEFALLFELITASIEVVTKDLYAHKMQEADSLIGSADKGDVPFLALALSIPNDGIWTENTKDFTQPNVKIWTTRELLAHMER